MNIIQIIGKHSPLLAAALEHNKPVEINPENVKTAINELLKVALQEYTDRIVRNANAEIYYIKWDDTPYPKIDKESITNQLPEFLKEIGI